jgi:MFS family permease
LKGLRFGATASLLVLFAINLANYMDRYVVIALLGPIGKEFDATDWQLGLLAAAFIWVYMVVSPFCGWLADRIQRRFVVSGAVVLWSIATALASFAGSFGHLFGLRAAVGVGEAGYNAAGQALLTDLYPEEKRNRVMAFFNLAIPVGSAIGFLLAGFLAKAFGSWRKALLIVGAPGVVLGLIALGLPQLVPTARGGGGSRGHGGGTREAYVGLLRDRVFMANAFGFAMQAFSINGLATLATLFLERHHGMETEEATFWAGAIGAGSGLIGTVAGMLLADALASRGRIFAYALVTGAGYLVAAPILLAALFLPKYGCLVGLFVGMTAGWLGTGPANAIVAERAPPLHRAAAFGLVVFILHAFGDASSPFILGGISTMFHNGGLEKGVALQRALILAPVMLVVGAGCMFACALWGREKSAAGAPGSPPE